MLFNHLKKFFFTTALLFFSINTLAFINMGYIGSGDKTMLPASHYLLNITHQPFINIVSLFAANINGDDPNKPIIYKNNTVQYILDETNHIAQLHEKGIKVLVTLLNNHQNAGWSCMTDASAAKQFADQIANFAEHYRLDGIDIDDEYDACSRHNAQSMIMIAYYLKQNPKFKGKLLTKALFQDWDNFNAVWQGHKLAQFLDYGWEMSYSGDPDTRLKPYLQVGFNKKQLFLGVNTDYNLTTAINAIKETQNQGYGGAMFYTIKANQENYLNGFAQLEYGPDAYIVTQ